jgi:hypothetical protein
MGFVVSFLLHGIFFAGCLALDYNQPADAAGDNTEINQLSGDTETGEPRS